MPDRRTPFLVADEKQTLREFLDYLRESIIIKATGLNEEAVRRPLVPTGTNLLWLVKHLARVETYWFQFVFAGRKIDGPPNELTDDDSAESVIGLYREAIAVSNEITDSTSDIGQLCSRKHRDQGPLSLRWVLVHMVEETARHAGHADILREQIDGQTGR